MCQVELSFTMSLCSYNGYLILRHLAYNSSCHGFCWCFNFAHIFLVGWEIPASFERASKSLFAHKLLCASLYMVARHYWVTRGRKVELELNLLLSLNISHFKIKTSDLMILNSFHMLSSAQNSPCLPWSSAKHQVSVFCRERPRDKHRLDKEGSHSSSGITKYKIYMNTFDQLHLTFFSWIFGLKRFLLFSFDKNIKKWQILPVPRWLRFQCPNHEYIPYIKLI